MGVYYHYVNFTKRERFGIHALGGNAKRAGLGQTLASRAFHLILVGDTRGRWARDSVAILGDDSTPDWERIKDEFVDIEANAIVLVYQQDRFETLGDAAAENDHLFLELCYLVATGQAIELQESMRERFGAGFLRRYKELWAERAWFKPKDLVRDPGGQGD